MKCKKILSLLLVVVLCAVSASAALAYQRHEEHTPVIIVPGYSGSPLYMDYGGPDEKQVWGLDMDEVTAALLNNIAEIGLGLGALAFGNTDRLADTLGREARKILEPLTILPNGSSKYDLTTIPWLTDPATSNNRWLLDNKDGAYISEGEIMGGIAETIGQENIFNFFCDFRRGVVDCARDLRTYVKKVKAYTGSDKVSILAVSHGGQVVGTYLSLFGTLGDLDNVVMTFPALGGAALAYDALSGTVRLDTELLIYYIECGFVAEMNFEWLLRACELGFLDRLLNKILQEYFAPVCLYWGSIWDFIPTEHYEEMKAQWLDPVEHAWLIEGSDHMHYDIIANYGKSFRAAQKAGANVSILAGAGAKAVSGGRVNADAIIYTASSTGALCAPYGERFPDGYTGTGSACKNPAHRHVSPSMEIDATHAWLPENTWFVEGMFHGMSYKDPYSRILTRKLLLTDGLADVRSDPQYPQFARSHNPQDALYVEFDKSLPGFITGDDTSLRIYNLSEKYPARILSIQCDGMDIAFDPCALRKIAPGAMAELKFTGTVPDAHSKHASITVSFLQIGSIIPERKTFDFTILGGI